MDGIAESQMGEEKLPLIQAVQWIIIIVEG